MVSTLKHGTVVVYDTEWTSWSEFAAHNWKQPGRYPEIIQIGAVKLDVADDFREIAAFQCFVRPKHNPQLSDYIINLTGITQEVIDHEGVPFPDALADFVGFIGGNIEALFSFGRDGAIVHRNCDLMGIAFPEIFDRERDVRKALVEAGMIDESCRSCDLPTHLSLPDTELSHNALGDARSIATAIRHLRKQDLI